MRLKSRAGSHFSNFRTSLFKGFVKPLLMTTGTATLAFLGFLLTPLKRVAMHLIYHEDARVSMSCDVDRVNVGEVIHIRAFILPSGPLGVSDGEFDVDYDHALVRLIDGQFPVATSATESSQEVPSNKSWAFVATAPGSAQFRGVLTTRYGSYPKSSTTSPSEPSVIRAEIVANDEDPHATRDNFSGKWRIRLGDVDGTMVLKQLGEKVWSPIPGHYELEDGTHGAVNEGYHDGHDFGGQLIVGDSVTKWSLDRLPYTITDDGFIKIQGQAVLLKAGPSGWTKTSAKPFSAEIALH